MVNKNPQSKGNVSGSGTPKATGKGSRKPQFRVERNGRRIPRERVWTAEGQKALDEYFAKYGAYPTLFKSGIFTPSKEIAELEAQKEAYQSALKPASSASTTARHATQPQFPSSRQPTQHATRIPARMGDSPASSRPAYAGFVADPANAFAVQDDRTRPNVVDGPLLPPGIAAVDLSIAALINNPDLELPPIPDIQKSYHQLEQERLHGPERPFWFPRHEWNRPVPSAFPYAKAPEDCSDDSEEDPDPEEVRLRSLAAHLRRVAAATAAGLWTPRDAMYYHKKTMRKASPLHAYYQDRYPLIPLADIDAKIEQEFPYSCDEERRCMVLVAENRRLVEEHNRAVLESRRRDGGGAQEGAQ